MLCQQKACCILAHGLRSIEPDDEIVIWRSSKRLNARGTIDAQEKTHASKEAELMKKQKSDERAQKDPVCGMIVSRSTAIAESSFNGKIWYFCDVECKKRFDASPATYVRSHRQHGLKSE